MVSLEFFPRKVLGTITLNPHPFAGEIKRHPVGVATIIGHVLALLCDRIG